MRNYALQYYKHGYGCSQCILKAAETKYNIQVSKQGLSMCKAINSGFGVGGMCSVVIAAVMVFGLMFDEDTAKRLRMKFMDEFSRKYKNFNCSVLLKERKKGRMCEEVIGFTADCIERLIESAR